MNWRNYLVYPHKTVIRDRPVTSPPPAITEPCNHQWKKWEEFSTFTQRRECAICGIVTSRAIRDDIA